MWEDTSEFSLLASLMCRNCLKNTGKFSDLNFRSTLFIFIYFFKKYFGKGSEINKKATFSRKF